MKLPESGLAQCEVEVFAFLDNVYDAVESGESAGLQPDPFHPQNVGFTDKVIAGVIEVWEMQICQYEIDTFPDYHYPAQQVTQTEELLVRTGWDSLSPEAQLYIVQGIWDILNKYRTDKPKRKNSAA